MNYITTIIDRLKIELEQAAEDALWASDMQNAIAFMSSLYLNHPETVVKITREVNEAETKKLIEEVRRDSAVCLDWCKDIRSVAAARQCAATRGIDIEVNGDNCNSRKLDDLKDSDIEYIRINDFGRVGHFYFFSDSGNVSFDVFPAGYELAVVNDVTLENFEEKLLSWNKERTEDELKELFPGQIQPRLHPL